MYTKRKHKFSQYTDMVTTSKFIPIPLFLVPTCRNEDKEMDVIEACQVCYDEFFKKAFSKWKKI